MDEALFLAGDIIMGLAMLATLGFAASYAAFFNWRRTQAGRSLMYFVGALVLWAGLSTFTRFVDGDFIGRPYIRAVVYAVILATVIRLVVVLWLHWRNTPQNIEPRNKETP